MVRWLRRWFSKGTSRPYQFGRGLNAQLHSNEFELYNEAISAFEEGRILDAYEAFLNSLQTFSSGSANDNIIVKRSPSALNFELFQGLLVIKGSVTDKHFEAHAQIADAALSSVALKRRLIERNYQLTYARYYSHETRIYSKIHLDNTSMSPQKVFFPLRELALNGDYEKEFIASEFGEAPLLQIDHVQPLEKDEKALKLRYLRAWIAACQKRIKHLPADDNAGMIAFSYLTLLLQIDYLIVPKRMTGRDITRQIGDYFRDDDKSIEEKNEVLRTYVEKLAAIDDDDFGKQLYRSLSTFSPMERTSHDEASSFIDETFNKVRWYKTNRYPQVILTIYHYIPLYLLYNFGMHPSLQALLHLLVEVQHAPYFEALGYDPLYNETQEQFEKRTIAGRIEASIDPYTEQFPELESFSDDLNYTNLEKFSYSFLFQIKHLDYSEL